jgi:ribose transport system substrate-binding protein
MLVKLSSKLLASGAALVLTVTATGSALAQDASGEPSADDTIKIGLAVANLQANFFNQIKQSVENYSAELGGIEVITVDAGGDGARQVSQVQDLIAQDIDALIYIPAGAAAASVPTELARAEGIPVINVDRNAEVPGDTFIATDSVTSAYEVCSYIFEQAGGEGEMLIVHGQKGTTPEVDRTEGCNMALAENPGIKVVGEQWSQIWSQDEGFSITQNLLQAHPEATIVWGQADALALGAAQAVEVAGLPQRIWVAGFDGDTAALEALRDGVFDVTATQQTQLMGRLAVDSALALLAGEEVPAMQLQTATLTTQENVEPFIENHP